MTYFTSDLHFGHANIMKFHPNFRKFQNINDMDNTLIRLWNSRVNPCDEVYNLGDVSFHKDFEQTLKILKRLNGKHVLILGNHDQEIRRCADELLAMRKNDNNALFEEICDYKELALKHGGESFRLALFHYPVCEWNGGHHGAIHLYGHIHANIAKIKGKALNVGYDLHGKILEFGEILNFVNDIAPYSHGGNQFGENEDEGVRAQKIKGFLRLINK